MKIPTFNVPKAFSTGSTSVGHLPASTATTRCIRPFERVPSAGFWPLHIPQGAQSTCRQSNTPAAMESMRTLDCCKPQRSCYHSPQRQHNDSRFLRARGLSTTSARRRSLYHPPRQQLDSRHRHREHAQTFSKTSGLHCPHEQRTRLRLHVWQHLADSEGTEYGVGFGGWHGMAKRGRRWCERSGLLGVAELGVRTGAGTAMVAVSDVGR